MIPGKIVTLQTEIINGGQISNAFNSLVVDNNIKTPCVFVTTKPYTDWTVYDGLIVVMQSTGTTFRAFRSTANKEISDANMDARYDFHVQAGQTFYVIERVE